jgi:hypothetical protein
MLNLATQEIPLVLQADKDSYTQSELSGLDMPEPLH